jgi:hypothetical protein
MTDMVPQKCDGPCGRTLMIWDTTTFFSRFGDGIGKIHICDDCLPPANVKHESGVQLNFVREKQAVAAPPIEFDPGFHEPEDGSGQRFAKRSAEVPWNTHMFWWFVHNSIAHPLIGFLPWKPFFQFHDWTSRKMHGR